MLDSTYLRRQGRALWQALSRKEGAHPAIRTGRAVVGFSLLGGGAVMLLLPGPGWLTIALALGLLSLEFAWAARLSERLRDKLAQARRWFEERRSPAVGDERPMG